MNDFKKFLSNLDAFHSADDTTLYKEIDPSFDTEDLINESSTQVRLRTIYCQQTLPACRKKLIS